jgi:methionine-rich copper-binding protein CopC
MRRLIVSALLAAFALVGLAGPASAHNVLTGSRPAAGATVPSGPAEVRFDFNEPVRQGPATITVLGPGSTRWERSQNATVIGNSVSTLLAPLGPAGVYTASYAIISADGHPVTGDITFTLTQAGTGSPITPSAAPPASGGGIPVWSWLLGVVVLLAVGLSLALRFGRSPEAAANGGART